MFNLSGVLVRAIAVNDSEDRLMVSFTRNNNNEIIYDSGASVSLLHDLRDSLNFRVQAIIGQSYISEDAQGKLTGIGDQLLNGKADVAIPLSYILPYRQKQLTALHPITVDKILVFFRQPPASTVRYIFLQPFTYELWISLLAVWMILYFSLILVNYIENHSSFLNINYWDVGILTIVAHICQQGWYTTPKSAPSKIILISIMMSCLVPFIIYSASIISSLSAKVVPIKSFYDLIQQKYTVIADPLIKYGQYLEETRHNPELKQMLETSYINDEDSVIRVFQGKNAFINTLDFFTPIARSLNYTDDDICDQVSWIPLPAVKLAMAFYVAKSFAYKEQFNVKLARTHENGLNSRYIGRMNKESFVLCSESYNSKTVQEKLGIRDLIMSYFLFLGLGSISIALMILECFLHKNKCND